MSEQNIEFDCSNRITSYLSSGGLFNPEFMEHEKARDLLIDCRKELDEMRDALNKIDNSNDDMKYFNSDIHVIIHEIREKFNLDKV